MNTAKYTKAVQGTSALKIDTTQGTAQIVDFSNLQKRYHANVKATPAVLDVRDARVRTHAFITDCIDKSEMACSLKYESMRGIPKGDISKRDLIISGVIFAVFALVVALLV